MQVLLPRAITQHICAGREKEEPASWLLCCFPLPCPGRWGCWATWCSVMKEPCEQLSPSLGEWGTCQCQPLPFSEFLMELGNISLLCLSLGRHREISPCLDGHIWFPALKKQGRSQKPCYQAWGPEEVLCCWRPVCSWGIVTSYSSDQWGGHRRGSTTGMCPQKADAHTCNSVHWFRAGGTRYLSTPTELMAKWRWQGHTERLCHGRTPARTFVTPLHHLSGNKSMKSVSRQLMNCLCTRFSNTL